VRRLILAAVVVAGALAGLDLLARHVAETELASRAKAATHATAASAHIGSFPFLYHLLAQGSVPEVDLHLERVPVGPLRLHELTVVLHGVVVDRHALLTERRVELSRVASATAVVTATAADLSSAVGDPVRLPGANEVQVTVAGRPVTATVALAAGPTFLVDVAGRPVLSVDLAQSPLVPDCAMALEVLPGEVELSCTVAPVPHVLLAAISGAA
jgi:hypothetical protein